MKCPACVEAGLTSRLDEHHGPRRMGIVERFFDEAGRRHVHDMTVYTIVMSCTNGHAFKNSFRSRCVCRSCAWNETPPVKAGEMKIGESTRGVAPRGAVDAA